MKYAAYHIDGNKQNEFRTEAMKLFSNPELKRELQERMINLNRETMSFDLRTGPNTPKEILELAVKFGTGVNSYSEGEEIETKVEETKSTDVKIKVTGNTFAAKELLKNCGFSYNGTDKAWYGNVESKSELYRVSSPSYSHSNQKLVLNLTFSEVK